MTDPLQNAGRAPRREFATREITPEAIDYYIQKGRQLREEYIRKMVLRLVGFVVHGFKRSKTGISKTASGLIVPEAGAINPTRQAVPD